MTIFFLEKAEKLKFYVYKIWDTKYIGQMYGIEIKEDWSAEQTQ